MAHAENTEVTQTLQRFFREYYADEIGELAQGYPTERKSLYIDWDDLYQFDPDLADDVRAQPQQLLDHAEEALRLYDLPADVKLGQSHVRIRDLPDRTDIRDIRHQHHGNLIAVSGIVRKATDVRPKITTAAFECQRCGTLTRIPMPGGDFQEPHECQACERQGPFRVNFDQSEFVDAQKLRIQESPEGLRGGETPQTIDVNIEDDVTGRVTAGDHVTVVGILKLEQQGSDRDQSPMFDIYMEGSSIQIDDEEFEEMDISDADKQRIVELSSDPDLYETMVGAIAPSIYGFEKEKLAMLLQLFSGVTKHLPDGSRIRGDLHMLLIGDPGTGKCVHGDTPVRLADGSERPIRTLVEANLTDPTPVDDGVYDTAAVDLPSLAADGRMGTSRVTRVWKRTAPAELCRIHTRRGRTLEVTPSHPLFVVADHRIAPKTAAELREGAFLATPQEDTLSRVEDPVPVSGETLRGIRTALGLSPADFSIGAATLHAIERDAVTPRRDDLRRLLDRFSTALEARGGESDPATTRSDTALPTLRALATDGGVAPANGLSSDDPSLAAVETALSRLAALVAAEVRWERIDAIESVEPEEEWVYDLEVADTHNYVAAGLLSHNSQLLQYVRNIAPRSVYTSGKGASTAGLTAAAVRDDFGEGQQWSLEAGALVLADRGIAAVDELDKMDSGDQSALHEALEQQSVSISKAGINATLKSRCSLLGAANPTYGRFDMYEPIAEQIDLEPALISRFDLIFTVTDEPDAEKDANLADHIITTNYAGELHTHRQQTTNSNYDEAAVEAATERVAPTIEPELLRKYIAYAKRNCFPTMTDDAKAVIRDYYVDLRAQGTGEDSPVPVTARKLEALVRLAEASARVRLSDIVEVEDAERATDVVHYCLREIGIDPETGQFDADVVETGTSKSQRDRIKSLKTLVADVEADTDGGAPMDVILERAEEIGMDRAKAQHEIEQLKQKGELYEPSTGRLRTT